MPRLGPLVTLSGNRLTPGAIWRADSLLRKASLGARIIGGACKGASIGASCNTATVIASSPGIVTSSAAYAAIGTVETRPCPSVITVPIAVTHAASIAVVTGTVAIIAVISPGTPRPQTQAEHQHTGCRHVAAGVTGGVTHHHIIRRGVIDAHIGGVILRALFRDGVDRLVHFRRYRPGPCRGAADKPHAIDKRVVEAGDQKDIVGRVESIGD